MMLYLFLRTARLISQLAFQTLNPRISWWSTHSPASCMIAAITAPDKASLRMMRESRSTSGDSDILAAMVEKISLRSLRSFRDGNSIFLSKRPGRRSAGSRVSARFVAIITCDIFRKWEVTKPSMSRLP